MNIVELPLLIDADKLAVFCRERGIRKLSLFGSVLREDFSATSDVDVLVEFLPGRTPGLAFFGYAEDVFIRLQSTPAMLRTFALGKR